MSDEFRTDNPAHVAWAATIALEAALVAMDDIAAAQAAGAALAEEDLDPDGGVPDLVAQMATAYGIGGFYMATCSLALLFARTFGYEGQHASFFAFEVSNVVTGEHIPPELTRADGLPLEGMRFAVALANHDFPTATAMFKVELARGEPHLIMELLYLAAHAWAPRRSDLVYELNEIRARANEER